MRVLECPECRSLDVVFEAGVTAQYRCQRCGYRGAFVIQRDLEAG